MANPQQELNNLRDIIARVITNLEVWTTLHDVCHALGLTAGEAENGVGKGRFLSKVTLDAKDSSIISAAKRMLESYPGVRGKPSESELQQIQDALWWIEARGVQQVTNVTRYRIFESLEGTRFCGRLTLRHFFSPILPIALTRSLPNMNDNGCLFQGPDWGPLASLFSGRQVQSTAPLPISTLEYFRTIGLDEWPDPRFCLLLERIVSPELQTAEIQMKLVEQINDFLRNDGFELRREGLQGGLPLYKARKRGRGVDGAPKYIIFASTDQKPDIVVEDAISMDIRVVRYADKCLVYDQPPPNNDLTWKMLLEWWGALKGADPNSIDVRRSLGFRLLDSLQSKPERILFETYFKHFAPKYKDNLPALIPQVYLHYDPRNQNERKKPVLSRQRMDFLLLLRNALRVVIEIDGVQHYADDDGRALPHRYAEMVAEDRRIKSLGYEVYRFGGAEFIETKCVTETIVTFFEELFNRYGIHAE